jgi:hypothetical protein
LARNCLRTEAIDILLADLEVTDKTMLSSSSNQDELRQEMHA